MYKFLEGVKVVELGHILLAPAAAQVLGDLGAEVIKVESLSGDLYRNTGNAKRNPKMSAQWLNCNRNKKSISIDLKSEGGKEILSKLIENSDVFLHNFRPKAVERLGFDYDSVAKLNKRIVYCFSSGFGQDGLYRDLPAFDDVIQAYSGISALCGVVDGEPKLLPFAVTDHITSLYLTQAILAAIYRQKATGEGSFVEVPMMESVVATIMNQHLNGCTFEPPSEQLGYSRMLSANRRPIKAVDGYLVHGVYTHGHWVKFFQAQGEIELLNDPMLHSQETVALNIDKLYSIVAERIFPTQTVDYWITLLRRLDIPCAPIRDFSELLDDPHLREVKLFEEFEHPSEGTIKTIRNPMVAKNVGVDTDMPAPKVGQHSIEVLEELNFTEKEIAGWVESGVALQSS